DFNGDGRPDLAVAVADSSGDVAVLLNTGDWRSFLVSGFPSPTTAGEGHTLTVTALDSNGTPLTSYTGTVHFTSSDPHAGLPPASPSPQAAHATHTFPATPKTPGNSWSVTVTDTGSPAFSGTQGGIVVNPAAASTFQVSGFPSPVSVGNYGYFTVTAYDAYGN